MYVPSNTLRLALLRVFAEAGANAGEALGFPEIARNWARTGLRDHDLRIAIRELLESGELRSTQQDGLLGFFINTAAQHPLHRIEADPGLARYSRGRAPAHAWD